MRLDRLQLRQGHAQLLTASEPHEHRRPIGEHDNRDPIARTELVDQIGQCPPHGRPALPSGHCARGVNRQCQIRAGIVRPIEATRLHADLKHIHARQTEWRRTSGGPNPNRGACRRREVIVHRGEKILRANLRRRQRLPGCESPACPFVARCFGPDRRAAFRERCRSAWMNCWMLSLVELEQEVITLDPRTDDSLTRQPSSNSQIGLSYECVVPKNVGEHDRRRRFQSIVGKRRFNQFWVIDRSRRRNGDGLARRRIRRLLLMRLDEVRRCGMHDSRFGWRSGSPFGRLGWIAPLIGDKRRCILLRRDRIILRPQATHQQPAGAAESNQQRRGNCQSSKLAVMSLMANSAAKARHESRRNRDVPRIVVDIGVGERADRVQAIRQPRRHRNVAQ